MKTYQFTTDEDPPLQIGDLAIYAHERQAHEEAIRLCLSRGQNVAYGEITHLRTVNRHARTKLNISSSGALRQTIQDWTPAAEQRYGPNPTLVQILTTAVVATIHCTTGHNPINCIDHPQPDDPHD